MSGTTNLAELIAEKDRRVAELLGVIERLEDRVRARDKRIAALEYATRTNGVCPVCRQEHFTLLADKRCSLCVRDQRIAALEAEASRLIAAHRQVVDSLKGACDERDEAQKRIAELEGRRRSLGCGYCGARVWEYGSLDPLPSEHDAALDAFRAHDAACQQNPLNKRIAALEAEAAGIQLGQARDNGTRCTDGQAITLTTEGERCTHTTMMDASGHG